MRRREQRVSRRAAVSLLASGRFVLLALALAVLILLLVRVDDHVVGLSAAYTVAHAAVAT